MLLSSFFLPLSLSLSVLLLLSSFILPFSLSLSVCLLLLLVFILSVSIAFSVLLLLLLLLLLSSFFLSLLLCLVVVVVVVVVVAVVVILVFILSVARHAGTPVVRDGPDVGPGGLSALPSRSGTGGTRLAQRPLGVGGQRHPAAPAQDGRLVLLRARRGSSRVTSPGPSGNRLPHSATWSHVSPVLFLVKVKREFIPGQK